MQIRRKFCTSIAEWPKLTFGRGLFCFAMICAAFGMSACTRPVEKSKFNLKLKVPLDSVSASSADRPIALIARVTGPGMSPVEYSWESPCNSSGGSNGCSVPSPASASFDVPQGSNRLVQVFRLMQGAEGLVFQYDDANVSMNTPEVNVYLSLEDLNATGAAQVSTGVRYLTGANSGPSGFVRVMI